METLLTASEADWALAKRRERVLSTLAESGVLSGHDAKSMRRPPIVSGDGVSPSVQIQENPAA